MKVACKFHCCQRTYVPLDLAFARTIHRFQGLSAGPVDEGKIANMYECIICDPDIKASEVRATGLFYTALSRATTLGDDDGLNSAIYFTGNNITRDRIQNVTMKANKNEEYINVTRRRQWMNHLKKNAVKFKTNTTQKMKQVFKWTQNNISYSNLHRQIRNYIAHNSA